MITQLEEQIFVALPAGFTVRGATLEDVEPSIEMYTCGHRVSLARMRSQMPKPFATNGFRPALTRRKISA